MMKNVKACGLLAVAFGLIFGGQAGAAEVANPNPTAALVNAMRMNRKTMERMAYPEAALKDLQRQGIIGPRPSQRVDYAEYYPVKKPARFMGHELVMFEAEYVSRYIGCCASQGVGITVKVEGDTANLEKFAEENSCSFAEGMDFREAMEDSGVKIKPRPGNYAALSCRERDVNPG